MADRYTDAQIELLSKNPAVKNIRHNRLTLTFEFRLQLFEEWEKDKSVVTIRRVLNEYGITNDILKGKDFAKNLNSNFKSKGKPTRGTNREFKVNNLSFRTSEGDNEYLVSTGLFIKSNGGIAFHPDFISEMYHSYPERSIEDQIQSKGIDPEMVGYQRIYSLKRQFDGNEKESTRSEKINDEVIALLGNHPFVSRINSNQFTLTDDFYNQALKFREFHIDEILSIFEIDHRCIDFTRKRRIYYKLQSWKPVESVVKYDADELMIKIQTNQMNKMMKMIDEGFEAVKKGFPLMNPAMKKETCMWIHDVPHDSHDFSIGNILRKTGIPRTSYYLIINNPDYGRKSNNADEEDVKVIKEVLESQPYPMGSRMVYMKMKDVTGKQFNRKKIMRLMKKYDLLCPVRSKNTFRRANAELLKRNRKPNLLKRQFRLARPLEIFTTDVSYLKYGNGRTAYLSEVKDPVSGRVLSCCVSDANDLKLVLDTVESLSIYDCSGKIFHSDQGTLYLSDTFQDKIKLMGFRQSMSRRGNCWDNAPVESFHGHFKDECDYKNCTCVEEVREMVMDYMDYYNNARPQWNRKRMTPVQYESYLLSMNDEEFKKYIDKEKQKYDNMMKKAAEKAKIRAQDIGAGKDCK